MSDEPTRLLKANAVRGLGSKIVFNFEDLRRNCDKYIEKVRHDAQSMIQDARKKSVTIQSDAYEAGHKTGLEQGLRDAENQIENRSQELADQMTLPAMHAAVELLSQERDCWLAEWEQTAVQLSLSVAEKLLRRKPHRNDSRSARIGCGNSAHHSSIEPGRSRKFRRPCRRNCSGNGLVRPGNSRPR